MQTYIAATPSAPAMRLEFEHPEEGRIRQLEVEIARERDRGNAVDALIEERKRIYDGWVGRLDREIGDETDSTRRDRLRQTRERAVIEYGRQISRQ